MTDALAPLLLHAGDKKVPLRSLVGYQQVRIGSGFASSEGTTLHFGLDALTTVNIRVGNVW